MDIGSLYEDLKKYVKTTKQDDDFFYDAPEGEVQIEIVKEMLKTILESI